MRRAATAWRASSKHSHLLAAVAAAAAAAPSHSARRRQRRRRAGSRRQATSSAKASEARQEMAGAARWRPTSPALRRPGLALPHLRWPHRPAPRHPAPAASGTAAALRPKHPPAIPTVARLLVVDSGPRPRHSEPLAGQLALQRQRRLLRLRLEQQQRPPPLPHWPRDGVPWWTRSAGGCWKIRRHLSAELCGSGCSASARTPAHTRNVTATHSLTTGHLAVPPTTCATRSTSPCAGWRRQPLAARRVAGGGPVWSRRWYSAATCCSSAVTC